MKILYIVNPSEDYVCDTIYHGLYNKDIDITDSKRMNHMYDDVPNKSSLYGKGFTIFGTLKERNIDRSNILEKIKDRFYDCIIYGSIARCCDYFDIVQSIYPKNRIIFIDGEDRGSQVKHSFLNKGLYFKREDYNNIQEIIPIQLSFPKEKICRCLPVKQKDMAFIIPWHQETYIYNYEEEYYHDYQISRFGYTCQKAGWESLRHYEIIANKCLPYFDMIEKCPDKILFRWPKKLNKQVNDFYMSKNYSDNIYNDLLDEFFEFFLNNLTTEKMTDYLLSFLE